MADTFRTDPDTIVRAVRWITVALTALQVLLVGAPALLWPSGAALLAGLGLVNVLSRQLPALSQRARRRLRLFQLVADSVLVLAFVWLFRREPGLGTGAILILPLLEGAFLGRLAGALGTWLVVTGASVSLALAAGSSDPGALVAHGGSLAVVAIACGLLAESLGRQMEAQRRAHEDADRRAQLLATVAAAARNLTSLDATEVLAAIVDSAIELGFDGAEMCVLTEDGRHWRSVHPRGLPNEYKAGIQPLDAGVAGLVYQRRAAVELDDYSSWESALPELRSRGLKAVFGTPVWSGQQLAAVLTAATYRDEPLTASEREAVELLAAQASRALENAHRYAEREELQQRLTHQAFHDALTGLPNRALLRDRLAHALARAERSGAGVAVLFLDLDGFKLVNDRAGHHTGDELLVRLAASLRACVRPGDTVARFGGDEFTVLLERVDDLDEAVAVTRRVLAAVQEPVDLGETQLTVSASIGIAWAGDGRVSDARVGGGEAEVMPAADRLLQQADRAMYLAKERGKGVIEIYDAEADRRRRDLMSLDAELRRALGTEQLRVFYQPLVRASDGGIAGVEALARWHHPGRGMVPPSVFIPVAEQSGTIVPLGRMVLEQSARAIAPVGGAAMRLNVNVSIRQLEHGAFADQLGLALGASGLQPGRLTLELSEQAVIDDADVSLRRTLLALREVGVQLAVDDFGRGFSSLRYLRELPVDEVKLDRSLVAGTLHTPEDRAIVRWTTALAHELGMRVTAEGVETTEQLRCLRDLGCDTMQGFLFDPALPFPDVVEAITRGVWPTAVAEEPVTEPGS